MFLQNFTQLGKFLQDRRSHLSRQISRLLWTCWNYFSSSLVYLFCNLQSASTVTAIDVKILKYFKNIWKFLSKISVWICWKSYSSSEACLCLPLLQFCSLCLDTHRRPQILHNHYKLNLTPQSQIDAIIHCTVARSTVIIQ